MLANKNIRIISLIKSTSEELDAAANRIFEKADAISSVAHLSIGQTYRTYESRTNKGAKSFTNIPFFTNSITIEFSTGVSAERIAEAMIELRDLIDVEE